MDSRQHIWHHQPWYWEIASHGSLSWYRPLVNESNIPVATNLKAVCELNKDQVDLFHSREGKDEDDDHFTVAICNNVPFRNKIIVICNNCSILY